MASVRSPTSTARISGAHVGVSYLHYLMNEPLRHREGTLSDIHCQNQLAYGVHRDPDPMRGTRQALDRLRLGDLTLFDGAEPGEQFVHLHLLDVEIA
jgi:hypothetical protein